MRTWLIAAVLLGALGCRSSPPAAATPAAEKAPPTPTPTPTPTVAGGEGVVKIAMAVTEDGFVPERVPAKKGQPLTLAITRKTDKTCAREIVFQGQEGKTALPLGKTVEVTYTPRASGQIKFGCAMGMMVSGVLMVD